mmetsp:Transcript_70376/g.159204  ORF Transcript_70376/g.159204 Transcript_70376/m.159204 type:complete len:225 (-) Transcript_70376:1003-1677(-)
MTAVIKTLGMTVSEFNQLSREVAQDATLRERVMQQAYQYRVAAQISASAIGEEVEEPAHLLRPSTTKAMARDPRPKTGPQGRLTEDVNLKADASAPSRVDMPGLKTPYQNTPANNPPLYAAPKSPLTVAQFARATAKVERLREALERDLKRELRIDLLPPGVCGPAYLPMLAPKVKAMCLAFPEKATELVVGDGVDPEEFNHMLARTKRDPFLRWKLRREAAKL